MSEAIVFASICPVCKGEQVQYQFNLAALHQLLKAGHPIDAYCEICDEYWPIGVQQRIELGEIVGFWRDVGANQERSPPAIARRR